MYKDKRLPADLYYALKTSIQNNESMQEKNEIKNFLEHLPFRLKIRTTMYVYKDAYEKVTYLKTQSESFLSWICPLLSQAYIGQD